MKSMQEEWQKLLDNVIRPTFPGEYLPSHIEDTFKKIYFTGALTIIIRIIQAARKDNPDLSIEDLFNECLDEMGV